jgi:excisionase family DNA binding protein
MLLTIKDLSAWLNIKPSTLYLWASQGKIPCRKIHGLIRFEREVISKWLQSFDAKQVKRYPLRVHGSPPQDVELLIEAAKRDAYTPRHGETISPSPSGKEERNGAR